MAKRPVAPLNGGPAFPHDQYYEERRHGQDPGMSLRDYFAAAALPTLLDTRLWGNTGFDEIATSSYQMADAMLKARATPVLVDFDEQDPDL